MDRASRELFARPALARHQDGHVRGRDARDEFADRRDGARGAEDRAVDLFADDAAKICDLAAKRGVFDRVPDALKKLVVVEGLGDKSEGAASHRVDGGVDRPVSREHDHRQVWRSLAKLAQQLEPVRVREPQVEHDGVEGATSDARARLLAVDRLFGAIPVGLEPHREKREHLELVVDQQHRRWWRGDRSPRFIGVQFVAGVLPLLGAARNPLQCPAQSLSFVRAASSMGIQSSNLAPD